MNIKTKLLGITAVATRAAPTLTDCKSARLR